ADIILHLVFAGDVGGDCQRLGGSGQLLDRGLEIGLAAVDGDDPPPALGEQVCSGAADEAGGARDDGDPAVETNAIGHAFSPSLAPVGPETHGPPTGALRARLSHLGSGLTSLRSGGPK